MFPRARKFPPWKLLTINEHSWRKAPGRHWNSPGDTFFSAVSCCGYVRSTSVRTASAIPLCSFLKLFRAFARGTFFVGLRIEIRNLKESLVHCNVCCRETCESIGTFAAKEILCLYYEKRASWLCWESLKPICECIIIMYNYLVQNILTTTLKIENILYTEWEMFK